MNWKRIGRILVITALGFLIACGGDSEPKATAAGAAKASSPPAEGLIVAMGDSLTAGLGVAETDAYPALLEARLRADGYRYRVINAGVSGETSSAALSRVDWMLTLKPDIVILETGANDGLRGLDPHLIEKNLMAIIARLKAAGVVTVLAGMQIVQNLGPEYTRAFAAVYPAVTARTGVIRIPFILSGVAAVRSLNQADGIHPTAAGYRKVVATIYPYVLDAIRAHRRSQAKAPAPK